MTTLRILDASATADKVARLTTEALTYRCRDTADQVAALVVALAVHARMTGPDAKDASANMGAAMRASCRVDTLRRAGLLH